MLTFGFHSSTINQSIQYTRYVWIIKVERFCQLYIIAESNIGI